jgi:hypothetical protein
MLATTLVSSSMNDGETLETVWEWELGSIIAATGTATAEFHSQCQSIDVWEDGTGPAPGTQEPQLGPSRKNSW